jgi:hypothetical protein
VCVVSSTFPSPQIPQAFQIFTLIGSSQPLLTASFPLKIQKIRGGVIFVRMKLGLATVTPL